MTPFKQNYVLLPFPNEFSHEDVDSFLSDLDKKILHSQKAVIVDCSHIATLYSFGLGLIIQTYKRCNEKGVFFGMVNLSDSIIKTLKATHLDKVINIYRIIEEFEILQFDTRASGRKVKALEFSYEILAGEYILINCAGIMFKGPAFDKMIAGLDTSRNLVFDFSRLSFIDADCLKDLCDICKKTNVYAFSAGEMVEEEIKMFELEEDLRLFGDLESVQKALK